MIMKHIGLQLLALLVCCAMISVGLVGCTEDKSPDGDKTPGGDVSDPTTDPEDTDGEKKELTVADFDPQKVYEQVDYFELDATKYVQLGRYKNLTLTIDPADYAVADATVQAKIDAILAEHHPDAKITDRPVQSGDTIVM